MEGGPPGEAFDGDIISRWQVPQQAGTYFLLDLGRPEWVNKLVFWPGDYQDVPSGYTLEASEDGRTWQAVDPGGSVIMGLFSGRARLP